MRIAMIGTGYVGLITGACFARFGHRVTCVDRDGERIAALRHARVPIFEPGLTALIETNVAADRLAFSTNLEGAVAEAEAVFIAVGTPRSRIDGAADLSDLHAAAREIAAAIAHYTLVVTKSTVPVGTHREVENRMHALRPDADFDVASNPEFLREGSAVDDFTHPDRVVCGTRSARAESVLREIYRPLFLNETPMLFTTPENAELIKYATNCFLATRITFINELADLCEAVDADVQVCARSLGMDGRIGPKFLHAGPGYGGSCFPKDTRALVATARSEGVPLRVVEAVIASNDDRKRRMADKIAAALAGGVQDRTLAILGLTFKPNTDDVREAPSLDIVPRLLEMGARLRAYDPGCLDRIPELFPGVTPCKDAYSAIEGADAAVILTEWNEFRALDLHEVRRRLRTPVLVDLRDIFDPGRLAELGFEYTSVGRTARSPAGT